MQLQDILFSQGFGTRRACLALIAQGLVQVGDALCREPARDFPVADLEFSVRGERWAYQAQAYLMLHKPAGTECSHRPKVWESVYSLLPTPLRQRPRKGAVPGVQAIGRLDQDATGLLLFTDDGALIHRLNAPRHLVPKVYEVRTADPVDQQQVRRLLAGVVLADAPQPVRASACSMRGEYALSLTLTQGKYHQVKRMIAAVGNRVVGLQRTRIGTLALPADLAPAQWRFLDAAQLAGLAATELEDAAADSSVTTSGSSM